MKTVYRNRGSVFLVAVFAVALMAVVAAGILQMSTEELQLLQNHLYLAEAMATAEAGLNDAFAQIRSDSSWTTGYTDKSFNGGTYTVTVTGTLPNRTIRSVATSSQGYSARIEAGVTVGSSLPHVIRIDSLRVNE
jgi:type II secretory pathway component PulK